MNGERASMVNVCKAVIVLVASNTEPRQNWKRSSPSVKSTGIRKWAVVAIFRSLR